MSAKTWHVARWHPLAWLETGIKAVAFVLGIITLAQALGAGTFAVPPGLAGLQTAVLALLALGLVLAIWDRFLEKELLAMGFVLVNNVAHWGMVAGLLTGQTTLLTAFCLLMLAGDAVKLRWLAVSDFRVRDVPKNVLVGLTRFYTIGYMLVVVLGLFP